MMVKKWKKIRRAFVNKESALRSLRATGHVVKSVKVVKRPGKYTSGLYDIVYRKK